MKNGTPTADDYVLDQQVGYLLRLASQRHAVIFQSRMAEGITPTQFSALVRLAEHGPSSQNQLGRLAAMDIATIKGVVDRLRQKGLVQTEASTEDRRRSVVSLTSRGSGLVDDLMRLGAQITDETLAPLSPSERRTLIKLLGKMA